MSTYYLPINLSAVQFYFNQAPASGYYLKAYATGTTTPISLFSTKTGTGPLAKVQLDSQGFPINGSSARFTPYVAQDYKLVLYINATDADANTTANAIFVIDYPGSVSGLSNLLDKAEANEVKTKSELTALIANVLEDGQVVQTFGYEEVGDGGHAFYLWDADSTATPTAAILQLDAGGAGRFLLQYSGEINVKTFGLVADDATDNVSALTEVLATGHALYFPQGSFKSSGNHTVLASQAIRGDGVNQTFIKHTSTTGVLFNLPSYSGSEVAVQFGGQRFKDFTLVGEDKTNAGTYGFKLKNVTDVIFDHVEIKNFYYGIGGVRDAALNSCTDITIIAPRILDCTIGLYAPNNWNGFKVLGGVIAGDQWSVVIYDSIDILLDCVFQNNGVGSVFLGGCRSYTVSGYCEGTASSSAFIHFVSGKDKDGNATNNSIPINTSPGGGQALRCYASSGAGTTYLFEVDGAQRVKFSGNYAGSGISTALAYLRTGAVGCEADASNYANPGTIFDYETEADVENNLETNISGVRKSFKVEKLNIGQAVPTVLSGNLVAYSNSGEANIYVDNGVNNDTTALWLNKLGYLGANTRFRRTIIGDGKGAAVFAVYPESARIDCNLPLALPTFTDGNRPAATSVPRAVIWNTSDGFPNFSNGSAWITASSWVVT